MSSPSPIRAVILDYAGVMTHPLSTMRSPGGGEVPFDRARMRQAMGRLMNGDDPDSVWGRLERGEIPLAHFIEELEREVPGGGAAFRADSPWTGLERLEVRDDMVARVSRLRGSGIPVALLTNNVAEWRSIWQGKLGAALSLFDAVVDSSAVGMRKPEARIFEHTMGLIGATASTTLFVDDLPLNVEGAQSAGLMAVLATDDDAHLPVLDAVLGG